MKDVDIFLYKTSFLPGEDVHGIVTLKLGQEMDIREFFIEILGLEKTRVHHHHGKHSHTHHETNVFFQDRKDIWSTGRVPPGTHTHNFTFRLPQWCLPSYSGMNGWVSYGINARVDVPLWFDVTETKGFHVYPPTLAFQNRPMEVNVGYPSGTQLQYHQREGLDRPGFFVRVHNAYYRPGETVTGEIYVHNPSGKTIRKVDFDMFGIEKVVAQGHTRTVHKDRHSLDVPFSEAYLNAPIGFSVPLPREVTTSFQGSLIAYRWELHVNLDVAWGFDTSAVVPLYVVL